MMETALAVAGTATGVALINKISDAIGWYATPHQVVRMANAEAKAELDSRKIQVRVGELGSRRAFRKGGISVGP